MELGQELCSSYSETNDLSWVSKWVCQRSSDESAIQASDCPHGHHEDESGSVHAKWGVGGIMTTGMVIPFAHDGGKHSDPISDVRHSNSVPSHARPPV